MSTYKTEWLENKSPEWKVATLKDGTGAMITEVSINKKNKKGEEFPNFDAITLGGDVEGELWTSSAGKNYLFAPRPTTAPRGGQFKAMQMEKVMDKKNESIAHFQGEKEMSIRIASTFRAASEMAVAEYQESHRLSSNAPTLEQLFDKWREWLWMHYEVKIDDYPPTI